MEGRSCRLALAKIITKHMDRTHRVPIAISDEINRIKRKAYAHYEITDLGLCEACLVVTHPDEKYEQEQCCSDCGKQVTCGRPFCPTIAPIVCGKCRTPLCKMKCKNEHTTCAHCKTRMCDVCAQDPICLVCTKRQRF